MRLTRYQHILFRLGELITYAEAAACFARRAARAAEARLHEKANDRFSPEVLEALARVFAREAAMKMTQDGLRWVVGSAQMSAAEISSLEAILKLPDAYRAQAGLISDLDLISDHLYKRVDKHDQVALQR